MNIILVPGTWANTDRNAPQDEWWKLGSPFVNELVKRGHKVYSFAWDTELEGLVGSNEHWSIAGKRLGLTTLIDPTVIAHSHGGQVATYAAVKGLRINKLVTLSTPVRSDVPYKKARLSIYQWIHVYGNYTDYMQIAGSILDGKFNWFRRQMKYADTNIKIEGDHTSTHSIETWDKYKLWEVLD